MVVENSLAENLLDVFELEKVENDKLLLEAFKGHLLERLRELGCSELLDEVNAALRTVGVRPFGHTRPDDWPYWCALDEVSNRHYDVIYMFRAAQSLAWADVYLDLGEPEESEEIQRLRKFAADDIEREKKDNQTFCDRCGHDLDGWSCYSGSNMQLQKMCRSCSKT